MTSKTVITKGETLDEAIKRGAIKLGVNPEEVSYEILVKGRHGLFGAKGCPYEISVCVGKASKTEADKDKYDGLLDQIAEQENEITDSGLGTDGYCSVEINTSGIYLTVFEPMGSGTRISLEKASTHIERQGIEDVDWDEVTRACDLAHGVPVKIAVYDAEIYREIQILVDIPPNEMTASITLAGTPGARIPSFEQVETALQGAGVVVGIDEEAIRFMLSNSVFNEKTDVVHGIQPTRGDDAQIKQRFQPIRGRQVPDEEEGGKVDFRDLNIVQNISKGEPIAEKIPANLGKEGRTVLGRVMPAETGRDLELVGGQNTRVSEDGLLLTATIDGHVTFVGKISQVVEVFEIKQDVDYSVGNIDFIGDVRIKGSVLDDFKVSAKGSIFVGDSVQSAVLVAGGSISVKGGIISKGRGLVKADEDITAKFVDDAILDAGKNVIVENEIMHSQVLAGEKVEVTGNKAVIVGGKIIAGKVVESKTIGSHVDVRTELHVGSNPRLIQEYHQVDTDLTQAEKTLIELVNSINVILEKQEVGKLPPKKIRLLKEWSAKRKELELLIEKLESRLDDLVNQVTQNKGGVVKISKTMHPGVVVHIGTACRKITDPLTFASLSNVQGEIRIGPYH
ncbi:MAG: FapA family protein [bacterium]|jgi:hypothetical protein|nr:FapA family protein [bacterium]